MASSVVWTDPRATERDHLISWTEKDKRPTGKRDRALSKKEVAELDIEATRMREEYAKAKIGTPRWARDVIGRSAAAAGVPMREILGSNQTREVVDARIAAAVELRRHRLSLPKIGQYLGGKHHVTIMHYLRVAESRCYVDGEIPCPDLSGEWAI